MKTIVLLVCAVLIAVADILILNVKRWRLAKEEATCAMFVPKTWKQIVCSVFMVVTAIGYVMMMDLYYARPIIFIVKRLSLLFVLWGVAVFDYREMRIPNKLILCGLALRLAVLVAEFWVYQSTLSVLWDMLLSELIAIGGSILVCGVCMLLTKGGLGMGDLKLIMLIGVFLGGGLVYAMFMSVFVAFIASVFLLITRKKSKKDVIPFAPFILTGTYMAMVLSGI